MFPYFLQFRGTILICWPIVCRWKGKWYFHCLLHKKSSHLRHFILLPSVAQGHLLKLVGLWHGRSLRPCVTGLIWARNLIFSPKPFIQSIFSTLHSISLISLYIEFLPFWQLPPCLHYQSLSLDLYPGAPAFQVVLVHPESGWWNSKNANLIYLKLFSDFPLP